MKLQWNPTMTLQLTSVYLSCSSRRYTPNVANLFQLLVLFSSYICTHKNKRNYSLSSHTSLQKARMIMWDTHIREAIGFSFRLLKNKHQSLLRQLCCFKWLPVGYKQVSDQVFSTKERTLFPYFHPIINITIVTLLPIYSYTDHFVIIAIITYFAVTVWIHGYIGTLSLFCLFCQSDCSKFPHEETWRVP